ncbi:MAG: NAD(P)-binding domain-containing protein, partial [Paracoccaceae bacterium]|nr:NAD(P)-binding domain-containing protein [Paracoccaceae bacterium]
MGRIALIGFGEAGQAVAGGLQAHDLCAYDIKIESPRTRAGLQVACASGGVAAAASLVGALAGAEVVFSLVTADQALVVAQAAAKGLAPDALYFDGNSCAPETKRAAAAV